MNWVIGKLNSPYTKSEIITIRMLPSRDFRSVGLKWGRFSDFACQRKEHRQQKSAPLPQLKGAANAAARRIAYFRVNGYRGAGSR
jgi:hypothetical protein